jgi:hypothetical protein
MIFSFSFEMQVLDNQILSILKSYFHDSKFETETKYDFLCYKYFSNFYTVNILFGEKSSICTFDLIIIKIMNS